MQNLIKKEQVSEHVLKITLNRPEVYNALNRAVLEELEVSLDKFDDLENSNIRALIITGSGEKSFCAGADLKERAGMSLEDTQNFVKYISKVFQKIYNLKISTIACLNGVAFGGGLELALACDLRIGLEKSQLGLTECTLGIIPGAGGTQLLPKVVGIAKAKELILTGKKLSTQEAFDMGLLNYLEPDLQSLNNRGVELATQIANNAPLAVQAAKKALNSNYYADSLENSFNLEHEFYESILHTQDRTEALEAFKDKRKPKFKGA